MDEKELKARLLKENQEFRRAFDQHQKLEKKLSLIQSRVLLTEDEKMKEKKLKKEKLLLKDKMYHIMIEFRKSFP